MTARLSAQDARLVRSAERRIAVQSAAVVALVVMVLSGLAVLVALRQQHAQIDSLLRQTTSTADDVDDPPASMWLTLVRHGRTTSTAGLPSPLPDTAALQRVATTGVAAQQDVHTDSRELRVRTVRRSDGVVVQAAYDLDVEHAERAHLLAALFIVGVAGFVLAGAAGLVVGRRAVRPLATALTLQREFVADAGHELRTPLTLLSTRVQLLSRGLRRARLSPELMADYEGVVDDTARMIAVVEDLLLAAEPASSPRTAEPVDLDALCTELADSARAYADQRGISLRVKHSDQQALTSGNAAALRRAVTALLDNALTHTPAGGSVTLATSVLREGVAVDVEDTGPGLPSTGAERVFDRFHSGGHRAGRRSYGLGLSLATGVANRHDGSLSVLRTGPAGTVFRLTLPRRAARAD